MRIMWAYTIHFMMTYGSSDTRSARAAGKRQLSGRRLFEFRRALTERRRWFFGKSHYAGVTVRLW